MRYEHQSCTECKPLGEYEGDDLWFCPQTLLKIPTVIARHSSEPGDYTSGMAFADTVPALREARRRAIEAGYHVEPKSEQFGTGQWLKTPPHDPDLVERVVKSARERLAEFAERMEYEQLGISDEYGVALESMLAETSTQAEVTTPKRDKVLIVGAWHGRELAAQALLVFEAVQRLRHSGQQVEVITIDSVPPEYRGEGGSRRSAVVVDGFSNVLGRAFVERLRDMPVALEAAPVGPVTHGPARRGKKGKFKRW